MSSCIVVLTGKLSKDPEMRYTQTGKAATSFSIPVEEYVGGDKKKKTVWYKITTWDKEAERCNQYLEKGSIVSVQGTLSSDENGAPRIWNDKDGKAHATFEISARKVDFLTMKSNQERQEEHATSEESELPF